MNRPDAPARLLIGALGVASLPAGIGANSLTGRANSPFHAEPTHPRDKTWPSQFSGGSLFTNGKGFFGRFPGSQVPLETSLDVNRVVAQFASTPHDVAGDGNRTTAPDSAEHLWK